MNPLPADDVAAFVAASALWRDVGGALEARLRFASFRDAIAFVVHVAMLADSADHHPSISNSYDRVTLRLTTHDADNCVTQRDIDLARAIESAHARAPGATLGAGAAPASPPRTPPPHPAR